jgi:GH24 family phage-related lysozyme (muramidase)
MLKTSSAQQKRIRSREKLSLRAYPDGKNKTTGEQLYSIGYGHQIGLAEQSLKTIKITSDKANELFAGDLYPLELQINKTCAASLPTQAVFDQFIDFGFNCGSGSLSKVLTTFNKNPHNLDAVKAQMLKYVNTHDNKTGAVVYSKELASRRLEEISLMSSPVAKGALIAAVGCVLGYLFIA